MTEDLEKAMKDIAQNRAKIIEDYLRAYLANNPELNINDIELCEVREANVVRWFVRKKEVAVK